MTGRDLIIYILQNNLEDEEILKDGVLLGLMSESEAAVKFNVGIPTIRLWYALGALTGVQMGNTIFIFKSETDPRQRK